MTRYAIRGGRTGYDRLLLLAREREQDTLDVLARAGARPGLRCLDLGCGGGAVTFLLAQLAGPDGHATGIDMDEEKLALAREAGRGIANVEFRAADITSWSEPAAYDLVYSRFLLQHLADPVDALRRMWAAVRPGGVLVIEDADFDGWFCEPPEPAFAFFVRSYGATLERRGGDATIGRKLHRRFEEASIPGAELTAVIPVHTSGELKTLALSTFQTTAEAMAAEGVASREEIQDAERRLADFTADPGTLVGGPRIIQIWARRTAAG